MPEERSVVDQALDLFVYAPLGLALEARELLPKLADRGRGQVALTRLAARFAADRGQRDVRRIVDDLLDGGTEEPDRAEPLDAALPIDDYDALTAREVLAHLSALADDELEMVLAHELANRRRSTVLNRIRQLQGAA